MRFCWSHFACYGIGSIDCYLCICSVAIFHWRFPHWVRGEGAISAKQPQKRVPHLMEYSEVLSTKTHKRRYHPIWIFNISHCRIGGCGGQPLFCLEVDLDEVWNNFVWLAIVLSTVKRPPGKAHKCSGKSHHWIKKWRCKTTSPMTSIEGRIVIIFGTIYLQVKYCWRNNALNNPEESNKSKLFRQSSRLTWQINVIPGFHITLCEIGLMSVLKPWKTQQILKWEETKLRFSVD